MAMRSKQKGMTVWGGLGIAVLLGFVGLLALKLFPAYLENMRVETVLKNVKAENNLSTMSQDDLVSSLEKHFDIEDITRVDPTKDLKIEDHGHTRIIRLAYEVRIPMAYNVTALLKFDDHVEVARVDE